MKQSLDFQIIDKAFKDNQINRTSYLNVFQPSFEDLCTEFKRFVQIYFLNYFNVPDLVDLLHCMLCHLVYEFRDTCEVESKVLLRDICQTCVNHTHKDGRHSISFDDIISAKCLYYKTVFDITEEQYTVFVKVFREARCVYLSLFLKRILTLRVSTKDCCTSPSNADTMVMWDVEESVASLGNLGIEVRRRNNDNYSVVTVVGTQCATCATLTYNDWARVAVGLGSGAVLLADVHDRGSILLGHSKSVMDLAFTKDADRLLTCSLDGAVKLWDTDTRKCLQNYRGHLFPVWSIASCPSMNNCFVSGGMDCSICLWDVLRQQPIRKMMGHLGSVKVTLFHECGRYVASGGDDGHVRLWDVRSSDCVRLWESKGGCKGVSALAFDPEAGSISWGTDSGIVECASLGGGLARSFNIGEHVSELVCRADNVLLVGTAGGAVYTCDSSEHISSMFTEESGRLLHMRGTRELGGPLLFVREFL